MKGGAALLASVLLAVRTSAWGAEPIVLSAAEAAKQGPLLAQDILSMAPSANFTNIGVLKIRVGRGPISQIPIRFETTTNATGWQTLYQSTGSSNSVSLLITYAPGNTNRYELLDRRAPRSQVLAGNATMVPFAGSDFWIADLGLEFLHWPTQRLLRKEIRRGQACDVLESINPTPAPGAYSRVVSWIDRNSDGIINAEASDATGKPLKDFAIKSANKKHGVKEMEIQNRQTSSRTWIEYDFEAK
jgi:hypothetical protein